MFSRFIRLIKIWSAFLFTALLVLFAVVNVEAVEISFFPLPYEMKLPKFLLAIICFALGLIVGGIVTSLKLSRAISLAKKEQNIVS